ncbi:sodium/potassium-transporting ATPase subunit gamma-like isoform X2 [Carassius carassius]|uniref:sodium/potassium-transporting ATPase subunit gamma-like isoform X2 n=1 Tax=Carassius carassius TaxID=217509 RepID=UPI002868E653|nr:sodium/potassium-transporting ATPase subunit gamma-like isoform X2 [Carassius carassius]
MAASTESYMYMDQSAFHYDYETLRTTGVILAVVMFVTGILIAMSKKFKCSKSKSSPVEGPQPPKTEVPPQTV